jgi:hypothetical protein
VEKDFIKPNYETLLDVHEIVELFENYEVEQEKQTNEIINKLQEEKQSAINLIEKLYTCKLGDKEQEEIRGFLQKIPF